QPRRAGRGGRRVRGPVAVLARLTRGVGLLAAPGPVSRADGRADGAASGRSPRPHGGAAPGEDRTPLAARPRGPGPAASWRGRWSLPVPAGAGRAGGGGVPWRCAVPKRGGRLESGTGSGNTRVPGGRGRVAPVSRTRAVRCGPRRERGRPVPTPWRYP